MFEGLNSLDHSVTLAVNGIHCPLTDHIWTFFSGRTEQLPFYVLMLAFLIWKLGWRKTLLALVGIALCIVACDQTAELVKYSVARLRPCHDQSMLDAGLRVLEGKGHQYGFFSAHAANSFGIAAFISGCMCFRRDSRPVGRYTALIFIWAALVAVSRVFVGKHFMGDILVGSAVGLFYGYMLSRLAVIAGRRIKFFSEGQSTKQG